jgi:hypothetical protein
VPQILKMPLPLMLIPLTLILALSPVSVQAQDTIGSAQLPESEMVQIVTSDGRPADCLAPLAVNKIDDEKVVVPAKGFLIPPGFHSINGRATLDTSKCPLPDGDVQLGSVADLEVDFVTGFTYY